MRRYGGVVSKLVYGKKSQGISSATTRFEATLFFTTFLHVPFLLMLSLISTLLRLVVTVS